MYNNKSQLATKVASSLGNIESIRARMKSKRQSSINNTSTVQVHQVTAKEEIISGIYADVLKIDTVNTNDSFFHLGGYSLLVIKVLARIRDVFGVELSLSDVFECPTPAGLTRIVEKKRGYNAITESILRRSVSETAPLSCQQRRIWFLSQLGEHASVYNLSVALEISDGLNILTLEQGFMSLFCRHEILRTLFQVIGGEVTQVIKKVVDLTISVIDYQGFTEREQLRYVQEQIQNQSKQPFDLSTDLPLRCTLFQLGASRYILHIVIHHIIMDASSWEIFTRELKLVYEILQEGSVLSLPDLHVQYADYAVWQNRWLGREKLEDQLIYWKKQLAEAPASIELPTDFSRPSIPTFQTSRISFELSDRLKMRVQEISQDADCTVFVTMLAVLQVLLYRYSGQDRISVGTPVSGRNRSEITYVLGMFLNTLVMHCRVKGDWPFSRFLLEVRKKVLGAYDHQDIPFEMLVEELNLPRDLNRNPVFQVMYIHQRMNGDQIELPEVNIQPFGADSGTRSEFDLTLSIYESEEGLSGTWEYSTEIFTESTLLRMHQHFEMLLERITEDPSQRIGQLDLLTNVELSHIDIRNKTKTEFSRDVLLPELFEKQVEKSPDKVAIVYDNQVITYSQLNALANQLAFHLHKLGVGPEVLVGIGMSRSLELVVGMLGILKAGGVYVPLDPEFPENRLTFMVNNSDMKVLLTQEYDRPRFKPSGPHVVCMDANRSEILQCSCHNPVVPLSDQNLAYVIYTSGSTGNPKGVEITHGSLVNFLLSMEETPGFSEHDRLLAVTTMSFDISALEIFLPLITGATVDIVDSETTRDGRSLANRLHTTNASIMQATPATWRLLLDSGWQQGNDLKVLCGGEALSVGLAGRLLDTGAELWNMYGPTESTIWASIQRIEQFKETSSSDFVVSIGRPIANTQTYVVGRNSYLVPLGVTGELDIGGVGLARGYLKLPEMTAERFIPDGFGDEAGQRLYRTGDLVRLRSDGYINFLGRSDHQVKIRGFRIELGEIESILSRCKGVAECVVAVLVGESAMKKLTAFIVGDGSMSTLGLRRYLKQHLPEYMIPSQFVQLNSLPRTPNNKVDRKSLSALIDNNVSSGIEYVQPITPVEITIGNIWGQVLEHKKVGLHDMFFDLGGHSLLVTKVVALIEQKLGIRVPYRLFFNQTLKQFASACQKMMPSSG